MCVLKLFYSQTGCTNYCTVRQCAHLLYRQTVCSLLYSQSVYSNCCIARRCARTVVQQDSVLTYCKARQCAHLLYSQTVCTLLYSRSVCAQCTVTQPVLPFDLFEHTAVCLDLMSEWQTDGSRFFISSHVEAPPLHLPCVNCFQLPDAARRGQPAGSYYPCFLSTALQGCVSIFFYQDGFAGFLCVRLYVCIFCICMIVCMCAYFGECSFVCTDRRLES